MDCRIPVMDGFESSREIRQREKYTEPPIIAVTANISAADRQRRWDAAMSDYLGKPAIETLVEASLVK